MASEAEPWTSWGDVVCSTFPFGLDQDKAILKVLSGPRGEGCEFLQPLRGRVNLNVQSSTITRWGRLVGCIGVKIAFPGRELPVGRLKLNSSPAGVVSVSALGLKPRFCEKTLTMTTSGEARNILVLGFESRRPENFRL